MMKRQFLRVKQIAEETFQKGEKTEVLTDELTAAEKRVESIRQSCHTTGKKLSACIQRFTTDGTSSTSSSSDRRLPKRVPEAALAHCIEEWGLQLGEGSVLGMTLIDCARIQEALACDLLTYKMEVEEMVVQPLQNILKVEIANVSKCRKQLAKLTAEMDTCKSKYQVAFKSCQQVSGNNLAAAVAKAELLKEEYEEASNKVDQCRDMLASEMFSLISREPELSQLYVKLCQLQMEYHKSALSVLESNLPEIEGQISSCPYHPVFGVPLEDHLHYTKREIALVIETCICCLMEIAMNEEGLFRIGGSITKIKKLKSAFDAGITHLVEQEKDPHNLAGVLKLYLRSLPEPLLTHSLYEDWMTTSRIRDHNSQLQSLWTIINHLPEANYRNLRYLVKFLSILCKNSDVNKMSYQNVAIVMGPNLLWPPVEEDTIGMNMTATNIHSSIVDSLITYADYFFPGECDFYVTTPTSPRHLESMLGDSLAGSQLSLSTTKLSNGDSAVDSLSSSPTNSPKSPSPRVMPRPKKKAAAPLAPLDKFQITRSVSCGVFRDSNLSVNGSFPNDRFPSLSISHENLLATVESSNGEDNYSPKQPVNQPAEPVKPARSKTKSIPPLVEKSRLKPSRPSVPPPDRPDPSEIPVVDISSPDDQTLSYMDDSDFEEEKSDGENPGLDDGKSKCSDTKDDALVDDSVFECESSHDKNDEYRTVINVDNDDPSPTVEEDEYRPLYKFSPPQETSIKLRINSNSQNTRL